MLQMFAYIHGYLLQVLNLAKHLPLVYYSPFNFLSIDTSSLLTVKVNKSSLQLSLSQTEELLFTF